MNCNSKPTSPLLMRSVTSTKDSPSGPFLATRVWSAGQLEGELSDGAWVKQSPIKDLVSLEQLNTDLWSQLIRDESPLHRLAADMPDDLSLN